MVLPVSPNTISMNQVNVELGLSGSTTKDFNNADVRKLAQRTVAGSSISMADLHGKAWINLGGVPNVYGAEFSNGVITAAASITFNTDGTYSGSFSQTNSAFNGTFSGNWTPTATNIGNNYWIRFIETAYTGGGGTWTHPANNTWVQLNTARSMDAVIGPGIGAHYRTWQISIAADANGNTILATRNGWEMGVEVA